MKLTPNFDSKEFTCKCGCGLDSIDIGLVNRLQVVRDILNEPITILSGCRCVARNKSVGGVGESLHTKGFAVDWTLAFESVKQLERICENLLQNWSGGFHYYPDQHFCHVDIGRKRRW